MTLFRPRVLIITGLLFLLAGLGLRIFTTEKASLDSPSISDTEIFPEALFEDIKGSYRPNFTLQDIHGQLRSIDEWDGKVVLVNFWATWCLPCLTEIPELLDLQNQYGDQGFQVIGIALQKAEDVIGFVAEHDMTYPVLAGEAEVIVIAESYGNHIGALPYTAIIDRDGIITFTRPGPITLQEVEELLENLLL